MKRALSVFAVLLAASGVQAAPYEGTWAPYREPGGPGRRICYTSLSDRTITITSKDLAGFEYRCRFTGIRKTGLKFVLDMSCQGDGGPYKDQTTLEMLSSDRMSFRMKSYKKNPAVILDRCPALSDQEKIRDLITLWDEAEAACTTRHEKQACEERELLHDNLGSYNQCRGKLGEAEDRKRWHECTPQSLKTR
jgi:hypothetical protein